ncbi:unnamed protein product [Owenia fusiformis]|uniref:Uncharacterized protein n=1 Tax=Owenia fusiformis TaxID=6347 RepID=A0A8J1ULD8_OWEFU|nr:unnamed protein product [Owenia fusiformis]
MEMVNEQGDVAVSQNQDIDVTTSGISVVHMNIPNQPVQVTAVDEDGDIGEHERRRREMLARRPSYRKILNELSSDSPASISLKQVQEESDSQDSQEEAGLQTVQTVTIPPGSIQLATGTGDAPTSMQTLTMTNSSTSSGIAGIAGGTTAIVQYASGPEGGQFFIPAGSVQAYQINANPSLQGGVVMATGGSLSSGQHVGEEQSRKRELRLLKNSQAARECRRKKKEYIRCLENRIAVLDNQNKTLIEELKSLKELYCQKE